MDKKKQLTIKDWLKNNFPVDIESRAKYNLAIASTISKVIKQRNVSVEDFLRKLGNEELCSQDVLTGTFDFDVRIKKEVDKTLDVKVVKLGLTTMAVDNEEDVEKAIIESVTLLSHLAIDYGE